MSHLSVSIWAFSTNFCPFKIDLSGNTVWPSKLQIFKNSPKLTTFGIFNQLLSTQNVNVARFARNVEWDFFCDFQTPCPSHQVSSLGNFIFVFPDLVADWLLLLVLVVPWISKICSSSYNKEGHRQQQQQQLCSLQRGKKMVDFLETTRNTQR